MNDLQSSQNQGFSAQLDESKHHDLNNIKQAESAWCNFFNSESLRSNIFITVCWIFIKYIQVSKSVLYFLPSFIRSRIGTEVEYQILDQWVSGSTPGPSSFLFSFLHNENWRKFIKHLINFRHEFVEFSSNEF